MRVRRRILYPLTAAAILAYFLFFTWKSLFLYFDADDMSNLYWAWSKPLGQILTGCIFFWTGASRPLGAIFYRTIFAAAGFDPLPFHVVALALGVVNMALCFWFSRLISGSARVAALATLLFAFQSRMMEVWFRTAVIYDVLCFTFLYLAVCLYVGARHEGGKLGARRIAAIVVCFILALDAKEMAVCLPVFLAAYELLFQRAGDRGARVPRVLIGVLGAMAVLYTIGKLHGPDSMTANPDYRLEFSYDRFADTWGRYLGYLFVRKGDLNGWISMAVLGALAAVALAWRSRVLLFAWVVIFFGMLPVWFAPPRGGFVMLVSWPGWVLFAATVVAAIEDLAPARWRTALACVVFVLAGWRVGKLNLHDQRADPRHWLYDGPALVRAMADQMRALHPELPGQARVLFVDDPFGTDEYTPVFILRLLYREPDLTIDRSRMMTRGPADRGGYRFVFTYESGRYRQLKPL